jgi:hypothetical protein
MNNFNSSHLIYLVSQPKAGSTMLQRILGGHSQIHTTAEPWIMLHLIYALRAKGHEAEYNALLAHEALQDFFRALPDGQKDYEAAIRNMALHLYKSAIKPSGKPLFLDKTPRYYLILPELARIMPDARFILLLRNPLAVLNSLLNASVKERWILLARLRNDLLLAPRLLVEAMGLLQERAIVVHYETLVTEPAKQVTGICQHLALDFQPDMLDYGENLFPRGAMGDSSTINKYSGPTIDRLHTWLALGRHPQTRHLAERYLHDLGPDLLAAMGYDYAGLNDQLMSQPISPGEISVTWSQLFEPDTVYKKRIQYAELALLLERRLIRAIRRAFGS